MLFVLFVQRRNQVTIEIGEGMSIPDVLVKDEEIVGLHESNNGRSCESHDCCGKEVLPDDLIRFHACVVTIDGVDDSAVKAVRVRDGTETCLVGFLPRNVVTSERTFMQERKDKD